LMRGFYVLIRGFDEGLDEGLKFLYASPLIQNSTIIETTLTPMYAILSLICRHMICKHTTRAFWGCGVGVPPSPLHYIA
jgi:hypothetical protein